MLATTRVAVEPAAVGDLHVAAGTMLRLDLAGQTPGGADHLTFVAGILDALRNHRPVNGEPDYAPSPNLRMSLRCELVAT